MASLIERLKFVFTGRLPARQTETLRPVAKIDAAQTSVENRNHWANADALGPNAALDTATRYKLRNRGRYEAVNNSYAKGMVRSLAYDLVGTGPRLELSIPGADEDESIAAASETIERRYAEWCKAIHWPLKLRLMEKGAVRCGEGLGILDTNMRLKTPVKLDVRLVEPEQCTTPPELWADPYTVDGVRCDKFWNPVEYYFLEYHPGETGVGGVTESIIGKYLRVPAEQVIHWFERERPGQARGIPRMTAALPLFAQLRRYTLATLTAAEFASVLAGVMKTKAGPGDEGQAVAIDRWELIEMVRGALLSLPEGWDATQFKPEQPTTNYGDFKREILNEAGRGPGAPLNIVTGNSSGYNYSSGRLDHVPYQRGLWIDRQDLETFCIDPVWLGWFAEASMVGQIPSGLPAFEEWLWTWNYDDFASIDPNKDAMADDSRLKNGTSTYAEVLSARGNNWREVFDQIAREKAYAKKKGLEYPILSEPKSEPRPAPASAEQAVAHAMAEAGVSEAMVDELIAELQPEFARLKAKTNGHNGHRLNGKGVLS